MGSKVFGKGLLNIPAAGIVAVEKLLRPATKPRPDAVKCILVLQYKLALGYCVHLTPLFEAIKRQRPEITVIVATWGMGVSVLRHSPYVDHLIETPNVLDDFSGAVASLRRNSRCAGCARIVASPVLRTKGRRSVSSLPRSVPGGEVASQYFPHFINGLCPTTAASACLITICDSPISLGYRKNLWSRKFSIRQRTQRWRGCWSKLRELTATPCWRSLREAAARFQQSGTMSGGLRRFVTRTRRWATALFMWEPARTWLRWKT